MKFARLLPKTIKMLPEKRGWMNNCFAENE
jgi:hypothetical protein